MNYKFLNRNRFYTYAEFLVLVEITLSKHPYMTWKIEFDFDKSVIHYKYKMI
jgi:hypothetical protein